MVMNLYIAVEENLRKASTLTLSNLGAVYELVLDQNLPFTLSLPILLAIALVFFLTFHRDTSGWGSFSGSGETKSLRTCDIFFCCSMDGRSLYDSTAWSDLCPVTDFMCLFSQRWSDRTVTAVALRQWLVRCGSIPARLLMFFSMLSSVHEPTGELQYQTLSSAGRNL